MPLLPSSHRAPTYLLGSGHLQTIVPALLRQVPDVTYRREQIELPDGDFLALDWAAATTGPAPARGLAIISHGLEGSSDRAYIRGMARALTRAGLDALAWNYRSCGAPNRLLRSYHLGDTNDLHHVIGHALGTGRYDNLYLTGFSAGGNITLKYLGEDAARVPTAVRRAAVFSVPTDLKASATHIGRPQNAVYEQRFLKTLRQKIRDKAAQLPGEVDAAGLRNVRSIPQFDELYTAPMHGFASAEAYYAHASAGQYLAGIRVPTLLLNAENDPFLPPSCFPRAEAAASNYVFLETPRDGGHVGFAEGRPDGTYYSERRAVAFLLNV